MPLFAAVLAVALSSAHGVPPPRRAAPNRGTRASAGLLIDGYRYGPRRRFKGVSYSAFEVSSFGGCWFTNSFEFYRQFEQLHLPQPPPGSQETRYELEFIGRQTIAKPGRLGGYGHLGMWSCQIRAETLISARLLSPEPPPRPAQPAD